MNIRGILRSYWEVALSSSGVYKIAQGLATVFLFVNGVLELVVLDVSDHTYEYVLVSLVDGPG
jgi:hypothetical protein